jgi:hypothetical protein
MVMMLPQNVNPVSESLMRWIQQQIDERRDSYDIARRYYNGEQDTALTDRLKKFLPPRLAFRDNYCNVVVEALAERLKVIGISSDNEAVSEWAWDLWRLNRMDYTQVVIHTDTVMVGDSYLLCDWDEENARPRWTHQPAEMIVPHYNEISGKMDWASKKWLQHPNIGDDPETRLNLYYPDRVEKYVARGGVWSPFLDVDDPEWPTPWLGSNGEPLGIPLVHFRNKPLGEDFGVSEISNIIPMQDLLNKTLIDLVMVLDTLAFPQRYTIDIDHNSSRVDILPGSVTEFHTEFDAGGQVGQWEAANVDGPLRAIETIVQHIAGISRTPQHLFQIMGGAPSGEALKTAESGLVMKAQQRQVNFGNSWEDCLIMALRIEQAFGQNIAGPDDVTVAIDWDDPETRNEQSHLESLKAKMELGITKRQLWREMGYSQEDIDNMEEDRQQERVAETNIGAEILRNFQGGEL